jgi:hypothetical protein
VRTEWHGERMTTSPGSRVSCETATRPPATARRSGPAYCVTHTSHRLSKSWGLPGNADRPTWLCAQVGRSLVPWGAWVDLCRRVRALHSRVCAALRVRIQQIETSARGHDVPPVMPSRKPGFDGPWLPSWRSRAHAGLHGQGRAIRPCESEHQGSGHRTVISNQSARR